ncbi:MAG: extradiol dioxygenase [Pseudonocardiales bacterium]|nr:MAG: extradiol dioxygenase [Pseudonocardiales bacterium]
MIIGQHSIIYTADEDADRAFFRDVLEFPATDAGGGWLIFRMPPAELAFHPTEGNAAHELFFMCDDISATVDSLTAKGVEFSAPISDRGWGLLTSLKTPGGSEIGLYEPRHPTAI